MLSDKMFFSVVHRVYLIQSYAFSPVEKPTLEQLETTKALIAEGVKLGKISRNYKLVGHDQISNTECPGGALTAEFSKWDNYAPGKPDFSESKLNYIDYGSFDPLTKIDTYSTIHFLNNNYEKV